MEINNLIIINKFSNETIKAFEKLFYIQSFFKEDIEIKDNCYVISVHINEALDAFLVLENASGLPEDADSYTFIEKIEKQGDEYVLFGNAYDDFDFFDDSSAPTPFEIRFKNADCKTKVYRSARNEGFIINWFELCGLAFEIVDKYLFSKELLNAEEMNNLPLIKELANLLSYFDYQNESTVSEFAILKQYLSKYGFNKALKRLLEIENASNPEKLSQLKDKFIDELNCKKYEPLFRELLEIVSNTQNGYKKRFECDCSDDNLFKKRNQIDSMIKAKGYEGEYPFYYKKGKARGVKIKIGDYYPKKFFVFSNSKLMHYIYCRENEVNNDSIYFDFCCGCENIKNSDQKPDLISFAFNSNGKPYNEIVNYSEYYNEDGELISDDLEQIINVSCKLAKLKKLSKAERKEYKNNYSLKTSFAMLPIGIALSSLISLIILAAFMLLGVLLCLVFGLSSEIPSMVRDIPWLVIYFISLGVIEIVFFLYSLFN